MFLFRKLVYVCLAVFLGLAPLNASAQLADKKVLTLDGAKKIAAAAEQYARKNQWNVVLAVVDNGGHLIYLQRIDGAPIGSIDVAVGKARASAIFRAPTKVFDDMITARPSITTVPNAVFIEGGVPVMVGGHVVGAVGVSGATSEQDAQIAEAGIAGLNP